MLTFLDQSPQLVIERTFKPSSDWAVKDHNIASSLSCQYILVNGLLLPKVLVNSKNCLN